MSLSLLDRTATADVATPKRRLWPAATREPVRTLFLQEHASWSYTRGEAAAQLFATHDDWMAAHAGGKVRLVLSTALTHQLVVSDASLPLEDVEALLAWARQQFVHYHGVVAQQWPLSAWLGGGQRGASAAHGIDLESLLRRAREQGVSVCSVQPWWAVALQAATLQAPTLALADPAELWIVEGTRVTRVCCGAGCVRQIEQHWLAQPRPELLAALIEGAGAPPQSSWVLGYGLGTGEFETHGVRCLGGLHGGHPAPHWLIA